MTKIIRRTVSCALTLLAFSHGEGVAHARYGPVDRLFDLRAAYPWVMNDGPERTYYTGIVDIGLRYTWLARGFTVGLALDRYQMKNTISGLLTSTQGAERSIAATAAQQIQLQL